MAERVPVKPKLERGYERRLGIRVRDEERSESDRA